MLSDPGKVSRQASLTRLRELRKLGVLTDEVAQQLMDRGQELKIPGQKVDWDQLRDSYQSKGGDLSRDELEQVAGFTTAAQAARRKLEQSLKKSERKPTPAQLAKLQALDAYLEPAKKVREAYIEATSRAAVQAVAGASFGPLATVAAYLAYNPAPNKRLTALVEQMQQLESGQSPLLLEGNQARPVHQEKLWQTKLTMLEEAAAAAKAGNPPEIDVQYFEMTSSSFVGRLARAAEAGCRVRINIDPSRPREVEAADVSVDDSPRKLRALLQILNIPNADVAISIFPVAEELGNVQQLMHRKLLRVGEKVLFGGMNANEGSGENFDTGYLVEGPAARKLIEGFQADVALSAGSTPLQVYGQKLMDNFEEGMVGLTPHGLATTLDIITGPSPAGTRIPAKPTLAELEALAAKANLKLSSLVDEETLMHQLQYNSTRPMELKPKGKKMLKELMTTAFEKTCDPQNLKRLKEMDLPQGKADGDIKMAVGSSSEEREALILQAIASAEKFCYVPTFVITKAMAKALIARRDELAAQGKSLDVRVVADAGMYGFGGTPNEEGYLALEDAGIPVRWSLLTRAMSTHDRKIHAKQVLTDKVELIGSTNLSNKGVRDNWELSGLVYFDEAKADSIAARTDGVERFERLWAHESISLNTQAAAKLLENPALGAEESRKKAIRTFLGMIANYETQTAKTIDTMMSEPGMLERALQLQGQGLAYGYARLQTCQEKLGEGAFFNTLKALPTRTRLESFAEGKALLQEQTNP